MAVGGVGSTITVKVTYSVDTDNVTNVGVSGGRVAVSDETVFVRLIDSVDAVVVVVVRLSAGVVAVSDDTVNVEVT